MNTLQDALVFVFNADRHEVDRLYEALKERTRQLRKVAAHEALATLTVGDHVELHGIRPKYLEGATGTVVRLDASTVAVRLDEGAGRFHGAVPVNVPASCLTLAPTPATP